VSARDYWDFVHETQDLFGLDIIEARDYYNAFKEVFTDGLPPTVDDLRAWGDLAVDLAEEYFPEEAEEQEEEGEEEELEDDERRGGDDSRYSDDVYDEEDYWVYEGEELEVTADLTYMGE
jgi:hypothetical protein